MTKERFKNIIFFYYGSKFEYSIFWGYLFQLTIQYFLYINFLRLIQLILLIIEKINGKERLYCIISIQYIILFFMVIVLKTDKLDQVSAKIKSVNKK